MSEFLSMGGYGAYVWTSYGITALALLLLFVWAWFGARARDSELQQVRKLSRAEQRAPMSATLSDRGMNADHDSARPVVAGSAMNEGRHAAS